MELNAGQHYNCPPSAHRAVINSLPGSGPQSAIITSLWSLSMTGTLSSTVDLGSLFACLCFAFSGVNPDPGGCGAEPGAFACLVPLWRRCLDGALVLSGLDLDQEQPVKLGSIHNVQEQTPPYGECLI